MHFDYCGVVWDICGKTLSYKLQRLQNRAACVRTHSSYDAGANQLIKNLSWVNQETRRKILKAEMVFKSMNGLTPGYLSSKFIQRNDVIASYNLRDSKNKLAVPCHALTIIKKALVTVDQSLEQSALKCQASNVPDKFPTTANEFRHGIHEKQALISFSYLITYCNAEFVHSP